MQGLQRDQRGFKPHPYKRNHNWANPSWNHRTDTQDLLFGISLGSLQRSPPALALQELHWECIPGPGELGLASPPSAHGVIGSGQPVKPEFHELLRGTGWDDQ